MGKNTLEEIEALIQTAQEAVQMEQEWLNDLLQERQEILRGDEGDTL